MENSFFDLTNISNCDTKTLLNKVLPKLCLVLKQTKVESLEKKSKKHLNNKPSNFAKLNTAVLETISCGTSYLKENYLYINESTTYNASYYKNIFKITQDLSTLAMLFIEKNLDENNFNLLDYAISLLKISYKGCHNLKLLASKQDVQDEKFWQDNCSLYKLEADLYLSLKQLYCDNFLQRNNLLFYYNPIFEGVCDINLFAFCLNNSTDLLNRYINLAKKQRKHWYSAYQLIKNQNNKMLNKKIETIAKYLCDTIDNISTKLLIYNSILFESIALEYAYKNNLIQTANKIVDDGYDFYLEFDTLFILSKYDREKYIRVIKELKVVCLKRRLIEINQFFYDSNRIITNLYGKDFCEEFISVATDSFSQIDFNDTNNPRLIQDRKTPNWAK